MNDTTAPAIRVMLVDDHPIVRRGLRDVLESAEDIRVCGESANADDAISQIGDSRPDVAVVDIMLEGTVNGIDLVKTVSERYPEIATLVLSMHDESIYAERAIKAGARGYLMKDVAPRNIIEAIRTVSRGELYLKEKLSAVILDKVINRNAAARAIPADRLTDRELEIFDLIGNGYSIKEIARKLDLSIYTIASHRRNIKEKLMIENFSDVTKKAIQWVIMRQCK